MYNEDEEELQFTMEGIVQNYEAMSMDPDIQMQQEDLSVVLVCDGYDNMPETFKKYAREKKFLDETALVKKGFMTQDKQGKYKMKPLRDIMDKGVKVPTNALHIFEVCTSDFGLREDKQFSRPINFFFAIKHKNSGKINSHKWFYQGFCEYLNPEHTLMLDIGSKPDDYALVTLFKYMHHNPGCGACCGEIEVDFRNIPFGMSYVISAA
jgi:cellulose synthase/poly-beta-1,6-N-acetylglucosamine synthase-like glycosyltransferase